MPSLRLAKIAGFMILVLLVGSNLVLPAGAHVTKRVGHLFSHLDPRYINASEMASNANLLDGQDSTAFLGANAKAADADLLDGQNSTAFMAGPGKVIEEAFAVGPGGTSGIMVEQNLFNIQYTCPTVLSNNGQVIFVNASFGTMNVFVDNGSTNPTYQQLAQGPGLFVPAAASGEFITFQLHAPNAGMATINVMSVHRASDCHVQAQAVISN
jgi:hypothetical protein